VSPDELRSRIELAKMYIKSASELAYPALMQIRDDNAFPVRSSNTATRAGTWFINLYAEMNHLVLDIDEVIANKK
jgi:hypothetical protein